MPGLEDLDSLLLEEVQKRFPLTGVTLKHPLPERPFRMLGLVHIDGNIFTSEKFARVLFLKTTAAFVRGVRSIFLNPRPDLDLPVFSSELILKGDKRLMLLDIHRMGDASRHDDTGLYRRVDSILNTYPDLFSTPKPLRGEINRIFSPAVRYVELSRDQDEQALRCYREYLDLYLTMVENALPLTGDDLDTARKNFEAYMNTIADFDPGVKVYQMFFGKKGGLERALDMFFGR